ncbi:hypothetical protein [Nocardia brasiliensis]|uniref:hypothetical protein n=1 Tax=Nocardia brasiliensis TaxID=37326 RepID=UPI002456C9F0|nr:hypothetical protein [Nocardia brasiliensis]
MSNTSIPGNGAGRGKVGRWPSELDSLPAINARLVEIEATIREHPDLLDGLRMDLVRAEEAYNVAHKRALVAAPAEDAKGRKTSASEREAAAFLATQEERGVFLVADAAMKYAADQVRSADREVSALQTRSANLRTDSRL